MKQSGDSVYRKRKKSSSMIGAYFAKLRIAWAYKRTLKYLLRKKGIRALNNFIFIKLFVNAGEGSGGGAFVFLEPILRRFPWLAPYPYNIEMEVTTKCNARCVICEHTYWNEKSEDLSFDDFLKIINQFPGLKWCHLTGEGSAFLNKDYLKMLGYLKGREIPVFFVDSFNMIDERIAKELIEIGVDGIFISLDAATKETYEKIRVGMKFERTLNNIRKFLELKKKMRSPIPEICFRFVVNNWNVHEMPQFIELVRSLGDREVLGDGSFVGFVGLLTFNEIDHLFLPDVPEDILQTTVEKAKDLDVHVMFNHTDVQKQKPPLKYCTAWLEPYIMMGGYVLPCCGVLMSNNRDNLRKYSFGNVFKKPFKDIWYSKEYRKFREMIPRDEGEVPILCKGCRVYDTTNREEKYGVYYLKN